MIIPSVSTPAAARPANAANVAPRTLSAAIRTRRRSRRSLTTPPTSRKSTCGSVIAKPTRDSALGEFFNVYASQANATMKTPSPANDVDVPIHRSRKSRSRSGLKIGSDAVIGSSRLA
jgi:hypothetical protein